MTVRLALFDAHPALGESLPHIELASLPTPVDETTGLAESIGAGRLFVKRDDLTGEVYGGNKVRKLEFLLGEAKARGAKEVMTFGYAGSNHCTATAVCAKQCGMRSISMLIPQPVTTYLRRNLLASHARGAQLNLYPSPGALKLRVPIKLLSRTLATGARPYLIPPGGSSPLGTFGFVNAAFELRQQIAEGLLPEPGLLYLPFSSMGSTAGLGLGLQAAGLSTRIQAIQVVPEGETSIEAASALAEKTLALLREAAPDFPDIDVRLPNVTVRTEFFGDRYAQFTPEAVDALRLFRAALDLDPELALDGTYSGKALAGLVADGRSGALDGETVLFWNTFNSRPFWREMDLPDYHELPKNLHPCFEGESQPLDTL